MRFVRMFGVVSLALLLSTCGEAPIEPQADVELNVSLNLHGTAITAVVIEVSGPGIPSTLAFNLTVVGNTASGTIILPAGTDRVVVVRGFDLSGIETHRGSATLDVLTTTNPSLNVTLLPITGGVPIVITIGSYGISVAPLGDTVAINDTVRLSATVTDGSNPLSVQPVWASLNPVTATVDSAGLVRGRALGPVTIVASYGGVAAAAQILVVESGGGGGGGGSPTYPGCLASEEIAMIELVNAARADSGRPPLIADTRLIQLARWNVQRVRDETDLDSVEFNLYGVPAAFMDFAWGWITAAPLWTAWSSSTEPARVAGRAIMLGNAATLVGVTRDFAGGITPAPRWTLVISTSGQAPMQDGSCFP